MQLHRAREAIRAAGAALVVVGSGRPNFVAGFREAVGYDGPIYCDPGLRAYGAAGLKRGVLRTLGPQMWARAAAVVAGGRRQGATRGDPWQQGGVLAIAPPGRVLYRHVSESAGDNAPPEKIVAALERARA